MANLLKTCLGEKFESLAPLVRQAHSGKSRLVGKVTVKQGNTIARLICNLFGMPPVATDCGLVIQGSHNENEMIWNREFDGFPMDSCFLKEGSNLVERLGPIHITLDLDVTNGTLTYSSAKTRVLGISLPGFFRQVS